MCCEKNGSFEISRYKNLIILLILLSYVTIQSFAVTAPFFPLDDHLEISACNAMESWWQFLGQDAFQLFRPVKNILFMLFKELAPYGMVYCRSAAILIGVLSFFPILMLLRRILRQDGPALLAASIWLLAPTLVSSTAWLSCVNIQVMCGAAVGALWIHDSVWDGERPRIGRVAMAFGVLFLALVSYESAIAVGPAIICFDFFLRQERFRNRKTWGVYVGYAVVSFAYLGLRSFIGGTMSLSGSSVGVSRLELCFASAYLTCKHFWVWLFPFGQMTPMGGYSSGWTSLTILVGCWVVVLIWVALPFVLRRRSPVCAFGLAFALLTFLPVSNILGFGNGPFGDYYLGLPSIGVVLVLTTLIMKLVMVAGRWRFYACSLAVVILAVRVFAGVEAGHWAFLWSDGIAAFRSGTISQPLAHENWMQIASIFEKRGMFDQAIVACDQAERLVGQYSDLMARIWVTRTMCAINNDKDAKKALACLAQVDTCLKTDNPSDLVHHWTPEYRQNYIAGFRRICSFLRGCVYEDLMNDVKSAEREYIAAMPSKWDCDTPRTADRLARLMAIRGDLPSAIALWQKASRYAPNDETIRHNLAIALKDASEKKNLPKW